jgi:hypothetical protein
MYFHQRYTVSVRDGASRYAVPSPSDAFPAAGVLDDLRTVPEPDFPVVLARYTALRCWLLRDGDAAPALVGHAGSAAGAHLDGLTPDGDARAGLEPLLAARTRAEAVAALETAADAAGASGHAAGARTLRQAAHRARWGPALGPTTLS